jgi:hypothetical protein
MIASSERTIRPGDTNPLPIYVGQIELSGCVALVGRSVKPRRGLIGVLINAVSGEIHEADVQLSLRVAPARSNKKLPGILLRDGRLQRHRLGLDVHSAREHHDRSIARKLTDV